MQWHPRGEGSSIKKVRHHLINIEQTRFNMCTVTPYAHDTFPSPKHGPKVSDQQNPNKSLGLRLQSQLRAK
jgi:hypothetical protein